MRPHGFRKIPYSFFLEGIFSVFGRYIEDYLRNLTCWEKSKNRFGLSATKLTRKILQVGIGESLD
jgi:hypothetical protein